MPREYKALHQATKEIADRTVIGIAAVHGNIDDGLDRSWPGSFADIADSNGRVRARFLWQHAENEPPIAAINYVREVPRADLPQGVLSFAPEATGGVEISRTYLDTPRGNEVLAGLRAGAIEEMSYAYEVVAYDHEEVDGKMIRNLRKMRIFDFSDVNHGMNPATVASKGLIWKDRPIIEHIEAVEAVFDVLVDRLFELKDRRSKVGRVLSATTRDRLSVHPGRLREVAEDIDALLKETEPEKTSYRDTNALRAAWAVQQQRLRELGVTTL